MFIAYGAQAHGLICGYRFTPAAGGQPITLAEALELLGAPADEAAPFVWLHFDLTDSSAQAWMQEHLPLSQEFFDALRQGSRFKMNSGCSLVSSR